jgi:peptide/nickel transport system ATP-binding protein
MNAALQIDGLTIATEAGRAVVADIGLTLARGEVLGLIGESGAGKTTIGLAALGHIRPGLVLQTGRVVIHGTDILALPEPQRRAWRGRRIAYVAQSAAAAFNPARRLLDQIAEPARLHHLMGGKAARDRALGLLSALDLPARLAERYPHEVSGGQLQRAMLAMAMMGEPDVLVLDEPTTALDPVTRRDVVDHIVRLIRDTGTAALYISHDLALVGRLADRLMVLRDGRMVETAATAEVMRRPQAAYTGALVAAVTAARTERAEDATVVADAPALALAGIRVEYGPVTVLDGVDVDVRRGETVALVGASGAGKSTLARVATGLITPEAGTIRLAGATVGPLDARDRATRRRLQFVPQSPDTALNPSQTVAELIGRPLTLYFGLDRAKRAERVAELLHRVDLSSDMGARRPGELSGGQKQRVVLARALAAEPDVLVLDEPTSALDPLVAEGILALLRRLQQETGLAYLFISHDLATVRRLAHRTAVLDAGRVAAFAATETLFAGPAPPAARRLIDAAITAPAATADGDLRGVHA